MSSIIVYVIKGKAREKGIIVMRMNALENEGYERIMDYLNEYAHDIAERVAEGDSVNVYAFYYNVEGEDAEWLITEDETVGDGYELAYCLEEAEYEYPIQRVLEDWGNY
ncbi:MAG: hypothetical protein Q4Q25_01300 [Methanocorpusculum sp.]|nr:hypothetical protein [Methanocorpusculum sp.]